MFLSGHRGATVNFMAREDLIRLDGRVADSTGGGTYKVELENGVIINAKLCGKMKRFNIRVIVGDKVTVGVSPYDSSHGFIVHRREH
jgi:translation initiation factor IF-1